jgi:transcription elongation factor GreA
MAEKETYLTEHGKAKLEADLKYLRTVRRQEVAERINQAKGFGDVMESGEYEEAKNEQGFVEGRIRTLESILSKAKLIPNNPAADTVTLGSCVTVVDEHGEQDSWTIVGSAEANSRNSMISNESRVGAALMGKKVGDKVTVEVPEGTIEFTVLLVC